MRTKAFATGDLVAATAIKTSIATVAAITTYSGAALNGAAVTANVAAPAHGFAAYPTATATNSPGSYVNNSTIQFVGTYRGEAVTRTATCTSTAGNGTFTADGPVDTVTSITVAAQTNTSGAWTFGFIDMVATSRSLSSPRKMFKKLVGAATGNIVVGYGVGSGAVTDTIPTTAGQVHEDCTPDRIASASTTAGFTGYFA